MNSLLNNSVGGLHWVDYFWNRIIANMDFKSYIGHKQIKTGMLEKNPSLLRVYIVFLLLGMIAYAGIAFLQYSLKWDMLDCYLPWRYFVGESIQNGVFPLWNPYQHLGYPIHADLRSVFYPEAMIVGLFGGYSVYTLHALFITYISLAGLGMYLLAAHFTSNHFARLMAGIVYLLSGYFVSHGQEMFGIIAATWIPFILYFFINLQRQKQWDELWKLALFLFLQLTGGYQALSIMLFYLLMALFLAEAIRLSYHSKWLQLKRLLIINISLAAVLMVSISVLIITFWQVAPHIGRFAGITLADAQFMPFSPRSLISFLLPFASIKDTAYFGTDLSMNNAYVGMLMLMLYLLAWFRKKNVQENIFCLFGLVMLFAAFGEFTPVREWLYDYVPLMNLFRMAAFFRYFFMISIILLGAAELGRFIENPERYYRRLFMMIALLALTAGVFVIHSTQSIDFETFRFSNFLFSLNQTLETSTRSEHMLVHGLIQLSFLTMLIAGLLYAKKTGKGLITLLLVFTAFEMTVAVKLNSHVTVSSNHNPRVLQQALNQMPEGFPLPDLSTPVNANLDIKPELRPLWRNTNILSKTVSADGFNSFRLDAFESFQHNYPALFEASIENPVLFLSDRFRPFSELDNVLIEPDVVWVHDSVYETIKPQIGLQQAYDTIMLKKFDPNHIVCEIKIDAAQVLTLMQANYPGWKVLLNGSPHPHFTSNKLFISCLVPAGSHQVEFVYTNKAVMAGFYLSYLILGLIVLIITFRYFQKILNIKSALWITSILFITILVIVLVSVLRIKTSDQKRIDAYEKIAYEVSGLIKNPATTLLIMNVDHPQLMNHLLAPRNLNIHYQRFSQKSDLLSFLNHMKNAASGNMYESLIYAGYNLPSELEVEEIIRWYFPNKPVSIEKHKAIIKVFDRDDKRKALFSTLNDFEQTHLYWTGSLAKNDTSLSFSGTYSCKIDAQNPGSPALVVSPGKLKAAGNIRIVASAQILLQSGADAALYIVVERDGKRFWQRSLRSADMIGQHKTWTKILLAAEPDFQLLADDVLKVFFWINGEKALYVDDFRVEIYQAEW